MTCQDDNADGYNNNLMATLQELAGHDIFVSETQ